MTTAEIELPAAKVNLPDDFEFPKAPQLMVEALYDEISQLIDEYLPPEWSQAIHTYAIAYASGPGDDNGMGDYECWVEHLSRLQYFLSGVRLDKDGHRAEWVGPAPKLGKVKAE